MVQCGERRCYLGNKRKLGENRLTTKLDPQWLGAHIRMTFPSTGTNASHHACKRAV